jgi:hypothetical protein
MFAELPAWYPSTMSELPAVTVAGAQAEPLHTIAWPVLGALALKVRPCKPATVTDPVTVPVTSPLSA